MLLPQARFPWRTFRRKAQGEEEMAMRFFMNIPVSSRHRLTRAGAVLAAGLFPFAAAANTDAPTVNGIGLDDFNISTLTPVRYITVSSFLDDAKRNSPFNNAMWNFAFVDGTMTPFVPATDFTVNTY